jgi:hypothetical protein
MTRVSDNPTEEHKTIVDLSGYGFVQSNSASRYKLGAFYSTDAMKEKRTVL